MGVEFSQLAGSDPAQVLPQSGPGCILYGISKVHGILKYDHSRCVLNNWHSNDLFKARIIKDLGMTLKTLVYLWRGMHTECTLESGLPPPHFFLLPPTHDASLDPPLLMSK